MIQIFTKLYKSVYSGASFFLPQFDLKQGKFIYDTTAQVIEERCGGKVIFLISEYFFASNVCKFAVNFCKEMESLVSGKKTMYTACLLYADEDELMAQLIIKLYKTAYKDALFFLPQFDLKHGKYILDTTAKVIDDRCDKKVVFLLSEYFYASHICQFAVNYAAAHGTGHGNLIPFHLTRNVTTVPNVLKGIAGIRWFRKGTREHTWDVLTDSLLAEKMENKALLADIKERIVKMVEKDKEYYLQDPPYDDDVGPPGEPIEVIEPEGSSSMPPTLDFESQKKQLEEEIQKKHDKKSKWKMFKQRAKSVLEKVFPMPFISHSSQGQSSSKSPSEIPLQPIKVTKTPSRVSDVKYSSNKQTSSLPEEHASAGDNQHTHANDSELGAVGGEDVSCNDLNADTESQKTGKRSIIQLNISQSESTAMASVSNEKSSSVNIRQTSTSVNKTRTERHDASQQLTRSGNLDCPSPTKILENKCKAGDIDSETDALISDEVDEKDGAEEAVALMTEFNSKD